MEILQTPRSHATVFTSTTESMPLTPTIAQIPKIPRIQSQSKKESPQSSPSERLKTPVVASSRFDWLEDVESMQVQLQQTIQRLENESAESINSTEQDHEEYARVWQAPCLAPLANPSQIDETKELPSREFKEIVEWRNGVHCENTHLPEEEEAMTSFCDDHLTNPSSKSDLERQKSWNSV